MKKIFPFILTLLAFTTLACSFFSFSSDGPGINAVEISVVTNTSLSTWMQRSANEFNSQDFETENGRNIYVNVTSIDSGAAITELTSGNNPDLWIPDEQVWVNLLNDQGNGNFQANCRSVAQSPLVIGMYREVAESLGWPGLPLGWLDIGSLATDSNAWRYYSGGEFGSTLRMGHTHPGLSGTGASTLLAVVQAAQSKTDAVTETDIQQPIVQASVGAFESGVSIFSTDSDSLGAQMQERGVRYLGAGIMHETTVLQYGGSNIVPIYPFEGTFMADFPACVNQSSDSLNQEAAQVFRDYLVSTEAQTIATSYGLRPINNEAEIQWPLSNGENGVDLSQPEIVFAPPTIDTIYAVQDLWQSERKDVNLVMLLDVSGSMSGSKINNMRDAAIQFVDQMGDDDFISIIIFSSQALVLVEHEQLGTSRDKVINAIARLEANGDTSLFDAIGLGSMLIEQTRSVNTTDALVVLTDGEDTFSLQYTRDTAAQAALASEATVFTIAYGRNADTRTLTALAQDANGNFYEGDEASIAGIYEEMSAAFGGSVGFGR